MNHNRKIVLQDGREFYGTGFGAEKDNICELVFNTSMVGYQEIISDPSYVDQMVVMTYPIIGNYGITDEDFESKMQAIGGLVVRDYNDIPSNFRYTETLSQILTESNVPAISGVDTRKLTRIIRDEGTQIAMITSAKTPVDEAVAAIKNYKPATDSVERVSTNKIWYSRTANPKYNVVAIDCGIKLSIIRTLKEYGCNVTVVPYNTSAEDIMALCPDGILVSNGPGNPADVSCVIDTVKVLKGKLPILGIGLGHEIIALAAGAKVYKLDCHKSGSHPVKEIKTGKIQSVCHNHSFAVDEVSLEKTNLKVTHINVLDGIVEGIEDMAEKIIGFQFHPECAPGPQDAVKSFEKYIALLEAEVKKHA